MFVIFISKLQRLTIVTFPTYLHSSANCTSSSIYIGHIKAQIVGNTAIFGQFITVKVREMFVTLQHLTSLIFLLLPPQLYRLYIAFHLYKTHQSPIFGDIYDIWLIDSCCNIFIMSIQLCIASTKPTTLPTFYS